MTDPIPADVFEAAYAIYLDMDGVSGMDASVAAAVAFAYRAGRESMMPKPKPPIVYVKPRGICSVCGTERALNVEGNLHGHDAPRNRRQRLGGYPATCPGSRRPPKEAVSE